VNTGNRALWITLGVVLTAAGVFGVLANQGVLISRDRTLLGPAAVRHWHDWHPWAVTVVIVAGVVLVMLGFLLLRAQLRGRGGAPMDDLVTRDRPTDPATESPQWTAPGRVRVTSGALHHALARDLQAHGQIRRASVRLVGDREHPQALVRLSVTPDADLTGLRSHVDSVLDRFATTSGVRPTVRDVVVNMADAAPARVA
jgi:hypothetical protein